MIVSLNWKPQSRYFWVLVLYLTMFSYRETNCFWNACIILPCCCYFQLFSDALSPRNTSPTTGDPQIMSTFQLLQVPATLSQRGSATSSLWEDLSFASALKSSQFPFPLWRNFSFFFKFQPENPSQHLPEKLYRKGLSSLRINQHWPDRMNRGREEFYQLTSL